MRHLPALTLSAALLCGSASVGSASAAPGEAVLRAGESLAAGESIVSGDVRAVMQSDGNLVVYQGSLVRFSSGTSVPGSRLLQQTDGNAVVYTPTGQAVWDSRTGGRGGDRLVVQTDGNLVQVGASGPVWSTLTGPLGAAPPAGNVLGTGGVLAAGQSLTLGGWQALMQSDGNLVVYANGRAQWSTGTGGQPGNRAVMQSDGNLVVYSPGDRPLFATGTSGAGSRLVVQADGNLVAYAGDGRALWSRTTGRPGPGALAGCPVPSGSRDALLAASCVMRGWDTGNRDVVFEFGSPAVAHELLAEYGAGIDPYDPVRCEYSPEYPASGTVCLSYFPPLPGDGSYHGVGVDLIMGRTAGGSFFVQDVELYG